MTDDELVETIEGTRDSASPLMDSQTYTPWKSFMYHAATHERDRRVFEKERQEYVHAALSADVANASTILCRMFHDLDPASRSTVLAALITGAGVERRRFEDQKKSG